jgi:hypothetical protein
MKTLIKMFAQQDKGVLFYETVVSFKQQRHTYIEASVSIRPESDVRLSATDFPFFLVPQRTCPMGPV